MFKLKFKNLQDINNVKLELCYFILKILTNRRQFVIFLHIGIDKVQQLHGHKGLATWHYLVSKRSTIFLQNSCHAVSSDFDALVLKVAYYCAHTFYFCGKARDLQIEQR